MSNQIYIPPINFNENGNFNSSTVSINAIEPLEYNKVNSNLSIKAATENNYGVMTTGTQTFKGLKTFSDNLTIYTGSVLTDPTNDTDISNKKYVDNKTTDLVKYNTSTKYLIDNKTNSNINNLKINNLSVLNSINGSSVSVSVLTSGYHGTDTKTITVYKAYVNGLTCIIFNKNTEINEYHWVSEIAMNVNGMVMDFSNFSDIYSSLPQMFELTGETSTYGGSKNVATKTLKFVKSSGYKYTVQYDKSFHMNLFKLKESIKNTDTYIFTSEANKIGTLTIDKGYLYNTPTENNNLVNKSYVDSKDTEIKNSLNSNVSTLNENIENAKTELNENIESAKTELNGNIGNAKTELNGNIENAKSELNGNITTAINGIKNVDLTTGTISTDPANDTDITNKKYIDNAKTELNGKIDNAKTELNAKITSSINGIHDINLTTGTISTAPTSDTDIANKKYVGDAITEATNSMEYVKYNSESKILYQRSSTASQPINNLNISTLTSDTSTISNLTTTNLAASGLSVNGITVENRLTFNTGLLEINFFPQQKITHANGTDITTCRLTVIKIKVNGYILLNFNFDFEPFPANGESIYFRNIPIADISSESYSGYTYYLHNEQVNISNISPTGTTPINTLQYRRTEFFIAKNETGTYDLDITTTNGDQICGIGEIKRVYKIVNYV